MLFVSEKEVIDRLDFDNPWWIPAVGIEKRFQELPRRIYFAAFTDLIKDKTINRAVILMGPRRVGKTVMAFQAIQELLDGGTPGTSLLYVSLETPLYTGIPLEKLVLMYLTRFNHTKSSNVVIFFDEIQYLKDWEVHLKSLVDSYPSFKFVATGSAAAALKLKSSESGAGRFTEFVLPPLTFVEYLRFINRENDLMVAEHEKGERSFRTNDIQNLNKEFCNYLNYGGYPEAVMSSTIQANTGQYIKSDIIDKVLLRDLPSLYGIQDIQELNRLFTTLAYNTGNEVTLEGLSQSAGVAKNTIKRYLEYLEAAFLIKRVNRIDQNSRHFKRITAFKVYLTNASMRSALFGHIDIDSEAMGYLTETAIYSQWLHSTMIQQLHYARWNTGEIDIVNLVASNQKPAWIVEVKWSDRPTQNTRELENCVQFIKQNKSIKDHALVTTKTVQTTLSYQGINFRFVPSSVYAYMVGANLLSRFGSNNIA